MELDEFIKQVCEKYNYDEELKCAIEAIIKMMIDRYGEKSIDDIKEIFETIPIRVVEKADDEVSKKISEELIGEVNPHLQITDKEDLYCSKGFDSVYAYETLYDKAMTPVGEKKYIITLDMKNKYNGSDYKRVFGTTINLPFLLHEINHAYAMLRPKFEIDDGKIVSKHGMYESTLEYSMGDDGLYKGEVKGTKGISLEESINESLTHNMLARYLKLESTNDLKNVFNEIHHVGNAYDGILMSIADRFIGVFGVDEIMDYRKNNNTALIKKFNELAVQSEINLEYVDGEPFEYFLQKSQELFQLSLNKYDMPIDEYGKASGICMMEAFAPLMAVEEILFGDMDINKYNEIRTNLLSQYENRENKDL